LDRLCSVYSGFLKRAPSSTALAKISFSHSALNHTCPIFIEKDMTMSNKPDSPSTTKSTKSPDQSSRRKFLGQMSGAAAATIAVSSIGFEPLLGIEGSIVEAAEITPTTDSDRVIAAKNIRKSAADAEKQLGVFPHPTNGDEELYPNRIGNFHKTLPHDPVTGEVNQAEYNKLLAALASGNFNDFELIFVKSLEDFLYFQISRIFFCFCLYQIF